MQLFHSFGLMQLRYQRGFQKQRYIYVVNVSVYTDVRESLKLEIYRYVEEQKFNKDQHYIFTEASKK